jgi:hypothetical protein
MLFRVNTATKKMPIAMKIMKRITWASKVLASSIARNAIIPVKAKPLSRQHMVVIIPRKEILL